MRHKTADLEPLSLGGRYKLLRRLAVGGMAEIYLARQAAMAGFEKLIVIKRLRAELAEDPRIIEMFLDEARIGAQLNHPNIVHVYDVDEHDGVPYIAMEYIVGEELNELCRRGLQFGRFLPIEHAVELIRQAATGMGYFHAKRTSDGPEGNPLEIVHLDISPTNLLVTEDGTLKVIDFGIARSRGQRTRGEVIPGKLSYMSPEQASRVPGSPPVDHRSDIFSLGIVLYEITVGRRLFRGTPAEVVPRLVEAQIEPPTFRRRNFPPALESIVMRALEKHPGDRYQSAYDLADDLETFLRDERLHSGPVRIARYLDMLAHSAGGVRRPELVSEAEARIAAGHDDLDFDSQVFDTFKASEGAPGPEQAPEWEEMEQPEGEVAAALGMELAELRALRTPVPMRPAGMAAVRGAGTSEGDTGDEDDGSIDVDADATPVPAAAPRRPVTVEEEGDTQDGEDDEDDEELDNEPDLRSPARRRELKATIPRERRAVAAAAPISTIHDEHTGPTNKAIDRASAETQPKQRVSEPVLSPHSERAVAPAVVVGASMLAQRPPSKLPWLLVALLMMAVAGLVTYIVQT